MVRTPLAFLLSLALSTSSLWAETLEKPFPVFSGNVRVPVGNHGSTSVEVVGPDLLKTTDGYGPHSEEIILNLQTGAIELTTVDYTPNETRKTTQYLPADQGGAYLPYRRQLAAMVGDLSWINQNLFYLNEDAQQIRKPEMAAVLSYLQELLSVSDAKAPESVALNPLPSDMRVGTSQKLSIEYLVRDDRELSVEVLDANGNTLKGSATSVSAPKGDQTASVSIKTVDVSITVPETAPLDQPGFVSVKLVPVKGSDTLAAVKQPATFKKFRFITHSSASYIAFSGPKVVFYTDYYCPQNCDVRVDIFNAQGQWVTSKTVAADAPWAPNTKQFTSVSINTPLDLFPQGTTYTYYVKILPQGANWDQYYDERRGSFQIGN